MKGPQNATTMYTNVGCPKVFRERRCVVQTRDMFLGNRNV